MNRSTFGDSVTGRRRALVEDLDEDETEEVTIGRMRTEVEGEVDGETSTHFGGDGIALEPFNLKAEREDGGYFDANENYVFIRPKADEIDAFAADLDASASTETKLATTAAAARRRAIQMEELEKQAALRSKKTFLELLQELFGYLQVGETVAMALKRLYKGVQKTSSTTTTTTKNRRADDWESVRRRPPSSSSKVSSEDSKELSSTNELTTEEKQANRRIAETLTELADALVGVGVTSVYHAAYDTLALGLVTWEYYGLDGSVYGPVTAIQMGDWQLAGHFKGESAVQMRQRPIEKQNTTTPKSGGGGGIYDDSDDEDDLPAWKKQKIEEESLKEEKLREYVRLGKDWISSDLLDFTLFAGVQAKPPPSSTLRSNHNQIQSTVSNTRRGKESDDDSVDDGSDWEGDGFRVKQRRKRDLRGGEEDDD